MLFIDARKSGTLVDRVHRYLTNDDIARIVGTYHAWRGNSPLPVEEGPGVRSYEDIPGFCKSERLEEIRAQGYVLTPGRYVGAAAVEEDDELFEQKMARLTAELEAQFEESAKLQERIRENLGKLEGM